MESTSKASTFPLSLSEQEAKNVLYLHVKDDKQTSFLQTLPVPVLLLTIWSLPNMRVELLANVCANPMWMLKHSFRTSFWNECDFHSVIYGIVFQGTLTATEHTESIYPKVRSLLCIFNPHMRFKRSFMGWWQIPFAIDNRKIAHHRHNKNQSDKSITQQTAVQT